MNIAIREVRYLREKAAEIRKKICITANQLGVIHVGGLLSATDMVTALYYKYLQFDLEKLEHPGRNRFVLSKGHCGLLVYLILSDLGLYEWTDVCRQFQQSSHQIWQHAAYRKGIEVPTGTLGHGLSISTGIALSNREDGIKSRIYCMVGDGEMHEGTNWEAIMYAGSHQLCNLVCIVDFNQCSSSFRHGDGIVFNWQAAFEAFGWEVKVIDGHNMHEIMAAYDSLEEVDFKKGGKPVAIVANTRKGHCIDFMQGPDWHVGSLDEEKLRQAIVCIENDLKQKEEEDDYL